MPGISERVYPDDMDCGRPVQAALQRVFRERYLLARQWLALHFAREAAGPGRASTGGDMRLVDIACGSGFGSAILSELGQVLGVDVDPDTVGYAVSHYGGNGRVSFRLGDANDRRFLDSLPRAHAIVSLATIEHLSDPSAFLEWVGQALLPGGACVLGFPANFTRDWAAPHHRWDISQTKARRLFAERQLLVLQRSVDGARLRLRDLRAEARANPDLPVPPLGQWVRYYLEHPHHFLVRMYQITAGPGILFSGQQYLLRPAAAQRP